jgi:hypothetical protein
LGQVQANKIKAKSFLGMVVWMAIAIKMSTRLRIGGTCIPQCNQKLIHAWVYRIRKVALRSRPFLLAVDESVQLRDITAFRHAFQAALPYLRKEKKQPNWLPGPLPPLVRSSGNARRGTVHSATYCAKRSSQGRGTYPKNTKSGLYQYCFLSSLKLTVQCIRPLLMWKKLIERWPL